ncbi:MAG: hypothetical protein QM639_17775 [Rhodocyclaceae bacterium]
MDYVFSHSGFNVEVHVHVTSSVEGLGQRHIPQYLAGITMVDPRSGLCEALPVDGRFGSQFEAQREAEDLARRHIDAQLGAPA